MTFVSATQLHVYILWVNSVLNVKVLVGAFNQEKALVGRGLLRDYEPSDGTFSSTNIQFRNQTIYLPELFHLK